MRSTYQGRITKLLGGARMGRAVAKRLKGVPMGSIYKQPPSSSVHVLVSLLLLLSPGLCRPQRDPYRGDPGVWQITATAVDTGAIAAAELGIWSERGGDQFVIVRVEFKSETDLICAPFTVRLEVSTGMLYAPEGTGAATGQAPYRDHPRKGEEPRGLTQEGTVARQESFYSIRESAHSYVFRIKEGESPVRLIVNRRADAEDYCRSHYGSFRPSAGPDVARLPLEGLPTQNDLQVVEQRVHPVRLGQLQIVTTAVATTSRSGDEHHAGTAGEGHHFAVVTVGIKNVGKDPNCSSLQERLVVDRGYEYSVSYSLRFSTPRIEDLLPGRTTGGGYVFAVHDGTRPTTLILERSLSAERFCLEKQHRGIDMTGGARLRVSLQAGPALNKD